jgi:hypothetical protein
MRTSTKLIALIFSTMLLLIIIPLILRYIFKISVDLLTISIIANVLVIPLMLITIISTENYSREHIKSVEDATRKQIESWERWELIHRKQSIKSLIKEIKFNMEIYETIKLGSQKEIKYGKFNNFILTSLEKSLYNPPIDNEEINRYLLWLYYGIKIQDNKLTATRTANITKQSLATFIIEITKDFEKNKKKISRTIEMLEEYEQKIKINPPER